MARYDDLSTGPIAYAAFVSTVLLLVTILLVRALSFSWIEFEEAKRLVDAHFVASDVEVARQKAEIADYAKVQVPGVVPQGAKAGAEPPMEDRLHIPVAVAQELLRKEWSATEAAKGE